MIDTHPGSFGAPYKKLSAYAWITHDRCDPPDLGQRAMEYYKRDVLSFLHQLINIHQKFTRRLIKTVLDVAPCIIVVSHINDEEILAGHFVAFHDLCELLLRVSRGLLTSGAIIPYIAVDVFHRRSGWMS